MRALKILVMLAIGLSTLESGLTIEQPAPGWTFNQQFAYFTAQVEKRKNQKLKREKAYAKKHSGIPETLTVSR